MSGKPWAAYLAWTEATEPWMELQAAEPRVASMARTQVVEP